MQIKAILNRIEKHRSFVYGSTELSDCDGQLVLEIAIEARANGRPICSGCGEKRPGYDRLPSRRFEYVPLWGILVFFVYAMRRVECPTCGVSVEQVPWAEGKQRLTTTYRWFLAKWARRLSWSETARVFRTTWENVFRAVEMAVEWGRARVDLGEVLAIGVDEIAWRKGHEYLTVVYQIDEHCRRLLWVGKDRKAETLLRFFEWFGELRSRQLVFVCSDMWKPYLQVVVSV
jgi:transposase